MDPRRSNGVRMRSMVKFIITIMITIHIANLDCNITVETDDEIIKLNFHIPNVFEGLSLKFELVWHYREFRRRQHNI
jgi:hypothetical protein